MPKIRQELKQDIKEFDLDKYLPSKTLQWCRTQLLGIGFNPKKLLPIPPAKSITPFRAFNWELLS
ncbi:hypothetical protein EYZ11_013020 [Aspergillus tanneri]|uniref:Uncharacterized protein n=1 Tax=Aspergillus tanneri TaxID=1220188 RepID=A0A4V3UMJ2_9EURO|nr:hypothetical protein EYZ11_013020 [Aspergillus tanneri]